MIVVALLAARRVLGAPPRLRLLLAARCASASSARSSLRAIRAARASADSGALNGLIASQKLTPCAPAVAGYDVGAT